MNIDIVYTWVDDSDPIWQNKKNALLGKKDTSLDKEANDACRYKNNDELKYSLRSIEKYAPWVNKIFIITDNQIPSFLNLENEKIKIISHKDLIDSSKLPYFNATAIETLIANIADLSEHFLYANDDMFFWKETSPDFFFENDKPICYMGEKVKNKTYKHMYGALVSKGNRLVREKFGYNLGRFPHHNIDSYKKSLYLECLNEFKEEVNNTQNHHFRDKEDFQRIAISAYMLYKNEAVLKNININPILKFLNLKSEKSQYINLRTKTLNKILNSKANLLCINDNRKTTDDDRASIRVILEQKFPQKSQFEK